MIKSSLLQWRDRTGLAPVSLLIPYYWKHALFLNMISGAKSQKLFLLRAKAFPQLHYTTHGIEVSFFYAKSRTCSFIVVKIF